MPAENHTLSMPHRNSDDRMFPDLAVKDLRIDGSTLFVLVTNLGHSRAYGPIRVAGRAEAGGVRSEAVPARTGTLRPGESRWVALSDFSVKAAAVGSAVPLVTLQDASVVSAAVMQVAPAAPAFDRSGQGCETCTQEVNQANNGLTMAATVVKRGRPD